MTQSKHCAVIGAGFIGLCTALELIERGCTVTLIDAGSPGHGASQGNAGFIASEAVDPLGTIDTIRKALPMLMDKNGALSVPVGNLHRSLPWMIRFALSAQKKHVARTRIALSALVKDAAPSWAQLLARHDLSEHLRNVHYLRVWETPAGIAAAKAEAAFYREWGIDAHFIEHAEMAALEPALASSIHHAVVLPKAHRISDPLLLCQALFKTFLQRGGLWLEQRVSTIAPHTQHVIINGSTYDYAVLCAGAHSAELMRPLGVNLPLMAERGYHLNIPTLQGVLNGPVCSADRNVFINSLDNGLRIVGFSELGGTTLPAKPERFASLRHHLTALLPQTQAAQPQAKEWMGMRPTLPDSLPVIDTHPHYPRLGFAFGHQHLGVTLAASTGQLIANKLLRQPTAVDLSPYAVTRFKHTGSFQ